MSRPLVIPFFIVHQGCPHRCVFCNQHAITGQSSGGKLDREEIETAITAALARPRHANRGEVQVAFYGGSFTCLPESRQRRLLTAVLPFIENKSVAGIRISTRPDYVDPTAVKFLRSNGVGIVELGVQSMSDRVLAESGRGHSAADSERAIRYLQEGGLKVGIQLMVGLPGDRTAQLFKGVERLASLKPDMARIYPAVVLKGSGLEDKYLSGEYRPLSLAKAVSLSGRIKEILEDYGVKVVRVGLQKTDTLEDEILAGPYHPAFGEMVLSRNLYCKALHALSLAKGGSLLELHISSADQSVLRGPGNRNLKRLSAKGLLTNVGMVFEDERQRGTLEVVKV